MKSLIAAILAALPGMFVGFVLWTALAICALVVYWIGYAAFYLGIVCGQGKFGLGWCLPPDPEVQQSTREYAMFFTVFAFTWGEILAIAVGAFFGGAAGVAILRLFSLVRRVVGRQRSDQGDQAKMDKPDNAPQSGQ
jgi:hypothetical protein